MLTKKVFSLEQQVSIYSVNENVLHEEITNMKKIHENFQKTIQRKCTIEEENWTLKDSIKMLQEGKKLLEQKMSDAQKDWEKQLTASKAQAEKVLSQTLAKMKEENSRTCNLLREEISSSKEEIGKLTKQMQNLEKEKHGEITKLRLKYDAKLLHLQQETAKAQQHAKSPMNSAVTHIFRQKYINTKQATDREIQSLKQTIASLQKKLEQRQEGTTSAKKRRF
ncbi:uncharacterized protein [Apostichopus japonicus]